MQRSTLYRMTGANAAVLMNRAAAQAEGEFHNRRSNILTGYMDGERHKVRCGFLWLKKRPRTDPEIARRFQESKYSLCSTFDYAWISTDACRVDAKWLREKARSARRFQEVLLDEETVDTIRRYVPDWNDYLLSSAQAAPVF